MAVTFQRSRAALEARILRDPDVMGGEAVLRGTRVPLRTVLATLAEGQSADAVVDAFRPSRRMMYAR